MLLSVLPLLLLVTAPSRGTRLNYLTDRDVGEDAGSYIVGGKKVSPVGKWPWQGSILTAFLAHQCGCVLVSESWVVTAAHCTTQPSIVQVVMFGVHDIMTRWKGHPTSYNIQKKIRHSAWTGDGSKGYPNDIALIKIRGTANLDSPYIGAVDLAPKDSNFTGSDCYITGWGFTRPGNLLWQNVLREAPTTGMENDDCEERFTELIGPGLINDGHICVGGRGIESGCMGDSGGPLVCKLDDVWVLAGVTSWGMGNCDPSAPSVYTRISYFRDWLTDNSDGEL